MRPRLAAERDWHWNSDRRRAVALQRAGRKKGRAIGSAGNGVVGIDAAIAEEAPDIVLLPAGLPPPRWSDGPPDQFGHVVRPARRVNQQRFEKHRAIDGRQAKKLSAVGRFERIMDTVTGS